MLESEIERNSISVNDTLEKDILEIFANNSSKITPHMKVFPGGTKKVTCYS